MIGANLIKANLMDANFVGANLEGANFCGTALENTNFSDAILTGIVIGAENLPKIPSEIVEEYRKTFWLIESMKK